MCQTREGKKKNFKKESKIWLNHVFASQSKNLFEYQIMLGLYENILIINIACKHDQFSSIVIHTVILKAVPVEFGDDKLQKWWTHVKYFGSHVFL